MDNKTLFFI